MKRDYKVIISGGGTGGHIFPALSIADAIKSIQPNADILFVGAENRMEMQRVPEAGYKIIGLPIAGFNRKHLWKNIKVLWLILKSQRKARKVIKDFKPIWNEERAVKQDFIRYWGYDYQAAIYQAIEDVSKAIPTKVSQLEDDTAEDKRIKYAERAWYAGGADLATSADWASEAGYATYAERDGEYRTIHETYAEKTQIQEASGQAGFYFNFLSNYNKELRVGLVDEGIFFTFEDGEYPDDYVSGLSFFTDESPAGLSYSGTGILNWVGTDCSVVDGLSIFQPSANKQYDIVFYYNGRQFIGLVNGYVPATGNSQG